MYTVLISAENFPGKTLHSVSFEHRSSAEKAIEQMKKELGSLHFVYVLLEGTAQAVVTSIRTY